MRSPLPLTNSNTRSRLDELRPPVRGLILDMDGVLWTGATPIGDLARIFSTIASKGLRLVAATNNAMQTEDQYLERLSGFGVTLAKWQIVTSSAATAQTLVDQMPKKGPVFVIGEKGMIDALRDNGFEVITDPDDERDVVAVVAGIDRTLTYRKLAHATHLVRGGAAFFGTNADATFPTPSGLIPGAGSIIAAVATAAEATPTIVGKPSPLMFQLAAQRLDLDKGDILVVGDRLATDVAGGQAFGARTALVLSGVSTEAQALAWRPRPDLIAADLAQLVGV